MPWLYQFFLKLGAVLLRALTKLEWQIVTNPDDIQFIQSRDLGRNIKIHVYHSTLSKADLPSRILINFHGSGFILPLHGSDDFFCRYISQQTNYTVLDVQYRLAPEHPFPAALNDVEDVVKWVLDQPERFDLSNLAISGFSAGGNFAFVAATSLFPPGTFRSVLTFYPNVEATEDAATLVPPEAGGKPLPTPVMNLFKRCYLQSLDNLGDPRISPALADLQKFPANVLIITAGYDSLAPEAERLAEKLRQDPNRYVVSERMEKCNHSWDKFVKPGTREWQLRSQAYDLAINVLQR